MVHVHNRQVPLKNYNKYKSVNNNGYDIMIVNYNNKKELLDFWYFLRDGTEISTLKEENNINIEV